MKSEKQILTTKFIVRAGIFTALALILYVIGKYLPITLFLPFLKLHFDEVPVFIASFAYGPLMGTIIIVLKTLISLVLPGSTIIGEIADGIYSLVFILPAAFIYIRRRKFSSVLIGFGIGFVLELIVSFFLNVYVMVPFFLGQNMPENPLLTIGVAATLPFNAIKNGIVIAITLPTYKSLHRLIDKIQIK